MPPFAPNNRRRDTRTPNRHQRDTMHIGPEHTRLQIPQRRIVPPRPRHERRKLHLPEVAAVFESKSFYTIDELAGLDSAKELEKVGEMTEGNVRFLYSEIRKEVEATKKEWRKRK